MNSNDKAQVTAVYPDDNYAVTHVEGYGSVTFSLSSFESEYPPEVGDWVILKAITKRDKGWRAKAACLLTPEHEVDLLPNEYPDTVLGKILEKWDPVFFFSLYDEEWEDYVKYQYPTIRYYVEQLDKLTNTRHKARILLTILVDDVRLLPFDTPFLGTEKRYGAEFPKISILRNLSPWSYFPNWDITRAHYPLKKASDQLVEFVGDVLVTFLTDTHELYESAEEYRYKSYYFDLLSRYVSLIPGFINSIGDKSPEIKARVLSRYDLGLDFEHHDNPNTLLHLMSSVKDFESIETFIGRKEDIIESYRLRNERGLWYRHVADYVKSLTGYNPRWKATIALRVVKFIVAQRIPYKLLLEAFPPGDSIESIWNVFISGYSLYKDSWSEEERLEMARLITDYLVVNNSSWVVFTSEEVKLTRWILSNIHPDDERLAEQVRLYEEAHAFEI